MGQGNWRGINRYTIPLKKVEFYYHYPELLDHSCNKPATNLQNGFINHHIFYMSFSTPTLASALLCPLSPPSPGCCWLLDDWPEG